MKRIAVPLVVASAFVAAGCGITVKDVGNVNLPLPEDYSERTFVADTASIRFELADHVGNVLLRKRGTNKLVETGFVIRREGFKPRETPIGEGDVYSSIVTRKAGLKGGYLAFAASLGEKDAQEVSIVDVMRTTIPADSIPQEKLEQFGTSEAERKWLRANAEPGDELYWAKSLILSRILKRNGKSREATGDATAPVFGANGHVYEQGANASTDWAIGAGLRKIYTVNKAGGITSDLGRKDLRSTLKEDETDLQGVAEVVWVKHAER